MKILPQGINNNAESFKEVYAGVENEAVRNELLSLALLLSKNQVALGVLHIVSGMKYKNVSEFANWLWQHIENDGEFIALLMTDRFAGMCSPKEAFDKMLSGLTK